MWLENNIQPVDQYPNYLLTTSLIEKRAMTLYPLYRDITTQDSVRAELESVISDESKHRVEIDKEIKSLLDDSGLSLEPCWKIETELYEKFVKELGQAME